MADDSTGPTREWLLSERARVRAHKQELEAQERRAQHLEGELAAVERALESHGARRPLPLLDRVRVASPCSQAWADMVGDDRTRHCLACNKDVYDVSAMSRASAEAFLQAAVGTGACVRMYRRADGTILTAEDCPVGVKKKHRKRLFVAVAASAASVLAAGAAGLASSQPIVCGSGNGARIGGRRVVDSAIEMGEPTPVMMGEMAIDPTPAPPTPPKPAAHGGRR